MKPHLIDSVTGKPSAMRVMCDRFSWAAIGFGLLSFGLILLGKEESVGHGIWLTGLFLTAAAGGKAAQRKYETKHG